MDRKEDLELAGKGEGIVHLEIKGNACILAMDHPETMNSMTPGIMMGLAKGLDIAAADNDVRGIIITGVGRAWCSGADVRSFGALADVPIMAGTGNILSALSKIRSVPKPVIAAVNGVAAGGGMNLCLLCDIRIFGESGRMTEVFVRRGLMPDCGGSWLLPRIVGFGKAAELIFTGDTIGAQECYRLGLANKVVPDAELMKAAIELVDHIAEVAAPVAVSHAKEVLELAQSLTLEQTIPEELHRQEILFKSADVVEGAQAFFEKRKPVWKGKLA